MASVKVVIDGAELQKMLTGPDGAIGRFMISRAAVVRLASIEDCPKVTGHLSTTIVTRYEQVGSRFIVRVAALAPYALFVHEGTEPHVIQGIHGPLAFMWKNGPQGDGMYFFNWVFHPGTKPNRFLSKNLKLFGAI